jgi:hypothetical protein
LQGLLLQLHFQPIPPQLSGTQVNLKRTEAARGGFFTTKSVSTAHSLGV